MAFGEKHACADRWGFHNGIIMKPAIAAALLLVSCLCGRSQITLNQGDVWTYSFNSLPYVGATNSFLTTPQGLLEFTVQNGTLQSGDMLRFETFEGTTSEVPICSGTMSFGSPLTVACSAPGAWSDLNGSIRFTMLSGSLGIDKIRLESIVSGPSLSSYEVYSLSFNPVPEPKSAVLLALVFGTGAVVRCRHRYLGGG